MLPHLSQGKKTFPWLNFSLIFFNTLVFIWQNISLENFQWMVQHFAFVPSRFTEGLLHPALFPWPLISLAGFAFLHGNWIHLSFNLLYLYLFGNAVEKRLGRKAYLILYLASSCGAALAQYAAAPESSLPMVGASGSVSGLLAAYLVFFPSSRVLSVNPWITLITAIPVPALIYILFWFLMQVVNALSSLIYPTAPSAWIAHAGGLITGWLISRLFFYPKQSHSGEKS